MHPLVWALLGVGGLFYVDAKVKPLGLGQLNPFGNKQALPPAQTPTAAQPVPIPGSPSVIVPPVPTLPAQSTLPALPTPAQLANAASLPQVGSLPTGFTPGVMDGDGAVNEGDIINVDMFRSGMAIPQNIPVVGLVFMHVDSMTVPGDTDKSKLLASFISPELMILGQQTINRSSVTSVRKS